MASGGWVAVLDKKEHKNWVMVGCALNIAKNGISPKIQNEMETWYQSLISSPPLQSLPSCTCALGAPKCVTCKTWESELIRHHMSPKPRICWNNSDRKQWGSPTGAWEIAKVFMPTLGSRKMDVIDAETTDIGGLLNLLEWCTFINPPLSRTVLSLARDKCRNHWAHAPKQELQDTDVLTIFGHLNSLLSDPVFIADKAAQEGLKDLQDLSHQGLVNVRESEIEALHLLRQSLVADLTKCQDEVARLNMEAEKVKEQGDLNKEEIYKLRQQLTDVEGKLSTIMHAVGDFNRLLNERGDMEETFEGVWDNGFKSGLENAVMELEATKSQLANLETNHANMMCKLQEVANETAENTKRISGVEKDVEALKGNASQGEHDDDSDMLCTAPSRLTSFTGRKSALEWLERNLVSENLENGQRTSCCIKTICGLGGCGKTSLALEFSYSHKTSFPGGVFWINGESDENLKQSVAEILALAKIATKKDENIDATLNRFLTWLFTKKRPWLLVVDNADELKDQTCPTGVKKIIRGPWQRNGNAPMRGHVLYTTRENVTNTTEFLRLLNDDCLELQCFSEEEGALFLVQRTGRKEESMKPEAILVAKELGALPLALEQAAAHISALQLSFKDYLDEYKAVTLRLLDQQPATARSVEAEHRLSVRSTWEMNFEYVKKNFPAAASMMRIAAFLESENVPFSVINPGHPEIDQEELRERAGREIGVKEVLSVLSRYSLFSVNHGTKVFGVHKLVQEVVRDSLTTPERMEALEATLRVLRFALEAAIKQYSKVLEEAESSEDLSEIVVEATTVLSSLAKNVDRVITGFFERSKKRSLDQLSLLQMAREADIVVMKFYDLRLKRMAKILETRAERAERLFTRTERMLTDTVRVFTSVERMLTDTERVFTSAERVLGPGIRLQDL